MDAVMTLAELAEASGVPGRTIRYYIARGLMDGPAKAGRGAAYNAGHLARLGEIQRLQAGGRTLAEIAAAAAPHAEPCAAEPSPWWQYPLAEDVVVWVKGGASPWRARQVRAAVEDFGRRLRQLEKENDTQ